MKKKLYGSILLIGGGLSFSQASLTLKNKLETSLPETITGISDDTIEVCSNPRVKAGEEGFNTLSLSIFRIWIQVMYHGEVGLFLLPWTVAQSYG